MTQLTADFEAGTNGNNILATDPGSANAWDAVSITNNTGLPPIIKYDNTQAAHGTLAAKLNFGATDHGYVEWSTSFGTVTDYFGRIYLYLSANPAAQVPIIQGGQGATQGARIDITTAGKLAGFDNPSAALFTTFTNAIALNQWVRIEYHFVCSATVGQGEVKLFNTADSSTPTETQTGTANKNTLANHTSIRHGVQSSPGAIFTLWMDDIVAGATSYPGPVSLPSTVAVVNSGGSSISNLDRELFNTIGPNRQDSFSPMPASQPQQKVGQPRGIPRQNLDW